jgi:hypothetical protein
MPSLPPPPQSNPAAALSMVNVRTHIPIELELNPPNYSMWCEHFLLLVGNFGASNHVDGTPAPNPLDAAWTTVHYAVHSLMCASLSKAGLTKLTDFAKIHRNTAELVRTEFKNLEQFTVHNFNFLKKS